MGHQIELAGLQSWKQEVKILYASSTENGGKRLFCYLNGTFELELKGEVVWRGKQPYSAVLEYNKY